MSSSPLVSAFLTRDMIISEAAFKPKTEIKHIRRESFCGHSCCPSLMQDQPLGTLALLEWQHRRRTEQGADRTSGHRHRHPVRLCRILGTDSSSYPASVTAGQSQLVLVWSKHRAPLPALLLLTVTCLPGQPAAIHHFVYEQKLCIPSEHLGPGPHLQLLLPQAHLLYLLSGPA